MSSSQVQNLSGSQQKLHSIPDQRALVVNGNEKSVAPMKINARSIMGIAALSVAGVVGIVFIVLGTLHLLGHTGSYGFIGSIAGGGGIALLSLGGILYIGLKTKVKHPTNEEKKEPALKFESLTSILKSSDSHKKVTLAEELAQEAISFARQQLIEKKVTQELPQENNPEPFIKLYEILRTDFDQLLSSKYNQADGWYKTLWNQQDYITALDGLMKVGYVCSYLELKKDLQLPLNAERELRDTYYWHIKFSYECAWMGVRELFGRFLPRLWECDYRQVFFDENTIEFKWRTLHNHFMDQLDLFVTANKLTYCRLFPPKHHHQGSYQKS